MDRIFKIIECSFYKPVLQIILITPNKDDIPNLVRENFFPHYINWTLQCSGNLKIVDYNID